MNCDPRGVDGENIFFCSRWINFFWFTCLINCFINRAGLRTKVILIECCNLLTRFLSAPCCCLFTPGPENSMKARHEWKQQILWTRRRSAFGLTLPTKGDMWKLHSCSGTQCFANLAILGSNNRTWRWSLCDEMPKQMFLNENFCSV